MWQASPGRPIGSLTDFGRGRSGARRVLGVELGNVLDGR
jgi:hypothetical protein